MAAGISNTLEVIVSVQDLAVKVIGAVKHKSVLAFLAALPAVLGDIATMAGDASLVLPELSDLDAEEVGELGTAAYNLVQAILAAVVA